MSKWSYEQATGKPMAYQAIRCLDCKSFLASKSELRHHKGHEVHYTDKQGNIDE